MRPLGYRLIGAGINPAQRPEENRPSDSIYYGER